MEAENFKVIYVGSSLDEAVQLLDSGDLCALIYCESGYGVAWLNGERAELRPNNAIALHSRGKSQGITMSDDFEGSFILCSGELAESLFAHYLTSAQNGIILRKDRNFLLTSFPKERNQKTVTSLFTAEGDVLYRIHTLLHLMSEPTGNTGARTKPTAVSKIKEYIDTHTDKKITLELLSKQFFISKTQIHRLFTAEYDIPPMKYMLKRKIEVSKELLTDTDMKISEIAESLSFTDSKHYTKTFRAFTGMLPRDYREANK